MLQEDLDKQIRSAREKLEDASTQLELDKALGVLQSLQKERSHLGMYHSCCQPFVCSSPHTYT